MRSISPLVNWRLWSSAASKAPRLAPISDSRFTISIRISFMQKRYQNACLGATGSFLYLPCPSPFDPGPTERR